MKLIHLLSPAVPPAHISKQGELAVNRERILQTILIIVAAVTLCGYLVLSINLIPQGQYKLFLFYTLISLVVFAFVAYRKLPYSLRAWVVVLTLLVTSILTFRTDGLSGNGKLYLLTFNALTTVLLGWKTGVIALVISQVGMGGLGFLIITGALQLPAEASGVTTSNPSQWVISGIFLAILATLVTFSSAMLIRGLEYAYLRVNRISAELADERNNLQDRVDQHTRELQKRLGQILTASDISRTISTFRDPAQLLPQIAEMIRDRFHLYYVGIFLVDESGNAVLKAGTGQAGEKMLAMHHSLPVGGASMIGWSIAYRQARVALDIGSEAVRFDNPALPETRSEMAIPIIREITCLGALSVQSAQPAAFDQHDIQILQGIADSLAIALENTRLFQQNKESLDEVRALNREYVQSVWGEYTGEHGTLEYTYDNLEVMVGNSTNQLSIPLSLRNQVIGQITLETGQESLAPAQLELIDAISTQTALALENARLLEETRRRASYEQTLNQLTGEFSRAFSVDDILKSALQQLSKLPAVNEVSIHLIPPERLATETSVGDGNGHHPGNGKDGKG